MTPQLSNLDALVGETLVALKEPASETSTEAETTMRERFYELIVLALGNLFNKSPIAGQMYDRTTLLRIIVGMDDNDAANLGKRADDWIRLEGIITQMEGQRSYFLPLRTMAALSTDAAGILLGDLFDNILKRYLEAMPSDNLRRCARKLASHFLITYQKS